MNIVVAFSLVDKMDNEDSSEGELEDGEDLKLLASDLFVLSSLVPLMGLFPLQELLLPLRPLVGDPLPAMAELPVLRLLRNQDHPDILLLLLLSWNP